MKGRKIIFALALFWLAANVSWAMQPHRPLDFLEAVADQPDKGQQIYEAYCALCHDPNPQIEMDAPIFRNPDDWNHANRPIADIVAKIDEGLGSMPPRGGCFECSDEDLAAAIVYMLPQ